jgi:hypothetical protein
MRKRFLMVAVASLLLVACGTTVAKVAITPLPTLNAPARPHTLVQYCVDDTGSYDRTYFHQANDLVEQNLINAVQPNSDELTLYATAITSDTAKSENTLPAFVIPATGQAPALALTPTPTPGDPDSFNAGAVRSKIEDANATQTTTYNQQMQTYVQSVQSVQDKVKQDAQRLHSWNPAVDSAATSIFGCLALAQQRFEGTSGKKYLIIASDMGNNTCIDCINVKLTGISVHIIFFKSDNAVEAQQKQAYWQGVFTQAGVRANDLKFDDPASSQGLAAQSKLPLFGGE